MKETEQAAQRAATLRALSRCASGVLRCPAYKHHRKVLVTVSLSALVCLSIFATNTRCGRLSAAAVHAFRGACSSALVQSAFKACVDATDLSHARLPVSCGTVRRNQINPAQLFELLPFTPRSAIPIAVFEQCPASLV
ncbi:hypothetical protein TRVL_04673 [Trypanosoma vivax]|nr:hypothetical protein TRVL_04673 [Trypanosoma vivax]